MRWHQVQPCPVVTIAPGSKQRVQGNERRSQYANESTIGRRQTCVSGPAHPGFRYLLLRAAALLSGLAKRYLASSQERPTPNMTLAMVEGSKRVPFSESGRYLVGHSPFTSRGQALLLPALPPAAGTSSHFAITTLFARVPLAKLALVSRVRKPRAAREETPSKQTQSTAQWPTEKGGCAAYVSPTSALGDASRVAVSRSSQVLCRGRLGSQQNAAAAAQGVLIFSRIFVFPSITRRTTPFSAAMRCVLNNNSAMHMCRSCHDVVIVVFTQKTVPGS